MRIAIRRVVAVAGYILALGSVGVSDYYTLVLQEAEPVGTWVWFAIGAAMLAPELIHMICKGKKRHDARRLGIIQYDPDAGEWGYFRPYDYDEETDR